MSPIKSPVAVCTAVNLKRDYIMGEYTVTALDNVSLLLYPGEFVVFLGPSGSGKSTLLNILGGLDRPSSGELHYREHDLVHASDSELTTYRREHVGFVFQFYNLIPSLTALENVELVTEIADNPMDALRALEMVEMGGRSSHFPSQLSGGEQQRVAIARAIAKQPDMLLCDEPTGALDLKTGLLVLEALRRANEQLGATVVIITHNAAIADMGDRAIRLADGRIASEKINKKKLLPQEIHW